MPFGQMSLSLSISIKAQLQGMYRIKRRVLSQRYDVTHTTRYTGRPLRSDVVARATYQMDSNVAQYEQIHIPFKHFVKTVLTVCPKNWL